MNARDLAWTLLLSYTVTTTRQALQGRRLFLQTGDYGPLPIAGVAAALWFTQHPGFAQQFGMRWTDLAFVAAVAVAAGNLIEEWSTDPMTVMMQGDTVFTHAPAHNDPELG